MGRQFPEIVGNVINAVALIIAVLALIVAYFTVRYPQTVGQVIGLPTPLPEIIERTVVATATPGPTPTPIVENVEQEVTRVVPVEVTRIVVVTATPTVTPEHNAEEVALENDFSDLDTSVWDVQSGNWQAVSGKLSLPYNRSAPEAGHVLAGFSEWDSYVIETSVSGLFDYPIGDDQNMGNLRCYFDVPSSRDGYSSDFMNGVPKARGSSGDTFTLNVAGCTPGLWTSRAAVLVGVDQVGPMAGLIIGENYMGWGVFGGESWSTNPTQFVAAQGSSGANIRIEVDGVEYRVFVNGQRVQELDYVDSGRSGGRFGLWARNASDLYNEFIDGENDWRLTPKFDYVRVTPLNGGD